MKKLPPKFITNETTSNDPPKPKFKPFKTTIASKPTQPLLVTPPTHNIYPSKNSLYHSPPSFLPDPSFLSSVCKSSIPSSTDQKTDHFLLSNRENAKCIDCPATPLLNQTSNIKLHRKSLKFPENYLNLLIRAADELLSSGLDLNSLHDISPLAPSLSPIEKFSSTEADHISNSISEEEDERERKKENSNKGRFQFRCQNKVCPVVVRKKSYIFKANLNTMKHKVFYLCFECFQAFKNGQYCYYCGVIYREYNGTKGFDETKMWVGCEYCKNWEHIQCEEAKGIYQNLTQILKRNKNFKYKCPLCRKRMISSCKKMANVNKKVAKSKEEKFLLEHKRTNGEITNKRVIKQKKNFDELQDEKEKKKKMMINDIIEDVEEVLSLEK